MKVTMSFIEPEKLKMINEIQAARKEFEKIEKNKTMRSMPN